MAEVFDLSALPSQLQLNQYSILALITLFSLSHVSTNSSQTGIGPYQMAIIGLAIWYGPKVIKEDIIPQKYRPFAILVGMVSLLGPLKLPLGDFSQPYHLHAVLLASLVYYAPAELQQQIQQILGTQNKYVLWALAFFFAPSLSGNGTLFEPYLQFFVVAAGFFVALIFTSTNFGGPLLWAYPERKDLLEKAKKMLPSWAHLPVLILVFDPWSRWWLIAFVLAASWQYLRFYHHTTSQFLLTRARSTAARASSYACLLQSEAASLERISLQAHTLAANVGRDALTAHHIGLTDFYTESTHAWAKLGDFRNAIEKTTAEADKLLLWTNDLRTKAQTLVKSDKGAANYPAMVNSVHDTSKAIAREGHEFTRAAAHIQAKTERFERAETMAGNSRVAHKDAATAAAACARDIAGKAAAAWKNAWNAEHAAEKLRGKVRLLEDVVAAGKRAEATMIGNEMEKAMSPADATSVPSAESTSAGEKMQHLYIFKYPAALPAIVDDSKLDSEDNEEEESD